MSSASDHNSSRAGIPESDHDARLRPTGPPRATLTRSPPNPYARVSAAKLSTLPKECLLPCRYSVTLMPVHSGRVSDHRIISLHDGRFYNIRAGSPGHLRRAKFPDDWIEEGSSRRLPAMIGAREGPVIRIKPQHNPNDYSEISRRGSRSRPVQSTVPFLVLVGSQVNLITERGCIPHSG